MLNASTIVFDEHVTLKAGVTFGTTYTSLTQTSVLTSADALAIFAHVSPFVTENNLVTLLVVIETSGDGRLWVQKNAIPEINQVLSPTLPNAWGCEPTPTRPSMAFVRLAISIVAQSGDNWKVQIGVASRSRTKRIRPSPVASARDKGRANPMSSVLQPATLREIHGHLLAAGHLDGSARAAHVINNLSRPARREVEEYTRKVMGMHPAVKQVIRTGAEALTHLLKLEPDGSSDIATVVTGAFGSQPDAGLPRRRA